MKQAKLRNMSPEQRAEISASKRFSKHSKEWEDWYNFYLKKLQNEILPAAEIESEYPGRYPGGGSYIRARPFDVENFKREYGYASTETE